MPRKVDGRLIPGHRLHGIGHYEDHVDGYIAVVAINGTGRAAGGVASGDDCGAIEGQGEVSRG